MTLAASVGWTLLRATALLLVFFPLCSALARWVRGSPWRWGLLAVPFVFPELLVGYAYAPWVAGRPWPAEFACALLLGLRTLPVAVVAWELTPVGPVTRSALYCQRLALMQRSPQREQGSRDENPLLALRAPAMWCLIRWDYARLWLAGPVRKALPAAGLFLLVAFQEFELAALLKATSWTDWLFVAQVQGLTLAESLRSAVWPALIELAGLGIVLWHIRHGGDSTEYDESTNHRSAAMAWCYVAVAWLLVVILPMGYLAAGLPAGLSQLAGQRLRWVGLAKETLVGWSASLCAAAVAWECSARLHSRERKRAGTAASAGMLPLLTLGAVNLLCCIPGLVGSLILSLALLAMFQRDAFAFLYDTPLPWLLGLTLLLLPRAVLLQAWSSAAPQSSLHLAELMQRSSDPQICRSGERLLWELRGEPRFLAIAMLAYWGYLELTLAYLLAPTGMTSGVVRLYNFMHFGRTSALSAEAAVLLLTPLLGTWCLWMFQRWRTSPQRFSGGSAK